MLTRKCPDCATQLTYRTVDAYMRATQRQSKCRVCAAKIDPRQKIEDAPATADPLAGFWRLLDSQASGSKKAA